MRSADDAMLYSMLQGISGKVETALKLMRLDAGQRQHGGLVILPQKAQIRKVGLDIFVDDMRFDDVPVKFGRSHTPQVG
jgi:hypothetical protein